MLPPSLGQAKGLRVSIFDQMLKRVLRQRGPARRLYYPVPNPTLAPPQVPAALRELLRDYPGHVERLQAVLNEFGEPTPRVQPLDEAVWAIQNRLDSFLQETIAELKAAQASGSIQLVEDAKRKRSAMGRALQRFDSDPEGFGHYFARNKQVFE